MNNPATRALRAVGASLTTAALACAALALGAAPASAAGAAPPSPRSWCW